jgi:DNA-binding LytR/AlgR family response regulator
MLKDLFYLVVDDEPLAIDVIENYLQRLDAKNITRCENAVEAFHALQGRNFDLVFLDIEMPLLSGLEFLKTIKDPPAIIITTAYREYAVEGFEFEVIDYLVKPIPFSRFMKAMEKVMKGPGRSGSAGFAGPGGNIGSAGAVGPAERGGHPEPAATAGAGGAGGHRGAAGPGGDGLAGAGKPAGASGSEYLFLKVDRKFIKVLVKDIQYIESLKDYIRVKTSTGALVSYLSLTEITEKLSPEKFIRIHRSFTIAIDKVNMIEGNCVEIDGKLIPISREHRQEVLKRIHG